MSIHQESGNCEERTGEATFPGFQDTRTPARSLETIENAGITPLFGRIAIVAHRPR